MSDKETPGSTRDTPGIFNPGAWASNPCTEGPRVVEGPDAMVPSYQNVSFNYDISETPTAPSPPVMQRGGGRGMQMRGGPRPRGPFPGGPGFQGFPGGPRFPGGPQFHGPPGFYGNPRFAGDFNARFRGNPRFRGSPNYHGHPIGGPPAGSISAPGSIQGQSGTEAAQNQPAEQPGPTDTDDNDSREKKHPKKNTKMKGTDSEPRNLYKSGSSVSSSRDSNERSKSRDSRKKHSKKRSKKHRRHRHSSVSESESSQSSQSSHSRERRRQRHKHKHRSDSSDQEFHKRRRHTSKSLKSNYSSEEEAAQTAVTEAGSSYGADAGPSASVYHNAPPPNISSESVRDHKCSYCLRVYFFSMQLLCTRICVTYPKFPPNVKLVDFGCITRNYFFLLGLINCLKEHECSSISVLKIVLANVQSFLLFP